MGQTGQMRKGGFHCVWFPNTQKGLRTLLYGYWEDAECGAQCKAPIDYGLSKQRRGSVCSGEVR